MLVFGMIGDNFLTGSNFFEITRLSVAYGLIAFSMTFVIKTGGIDLSVGSIMAIAAPAVPGAAEGLKQAGREDIKHTFVTLSV